MPRVDWLEEDDQVKRAEVALDRLLCLHMSFVNRLKLACSKIFRPAITILSATYFFAEGGSWLGLARFCWSGLIWTSLVFFGFICKKASYDHSYVMLLTRMIQGSRFKDQDSSFLRAYEVSSCHGGGSWCWASLHFTLLYFTFGCKRQHNNVLWLTPLYVVRRQLGCTLFKGAHCTPVLLLLNCRPIRTMIAEGTSAVYSGRGEGFSWFIRIGL